MSIEEYNAVIIGAGSAGIGSALNFLDNNKDDFIIIEAQNRIGGRFHTIDQGDSYLEIGAQWLHGEIGNPVFEFANANELLEDDQNTYNGKLLDDEDVSYQGSPILNYLIDTQNSSSSSQILFPTQNGEIVPKEIVFEFCKKFDDIMEESENFEDKILKDSSLVDYVVQRFNEIILNSEEFRQCSDETKKFLEGLVVWRLKCETAENGCTNLFDLSLKYYGTYKACDGNQAIELKYGYKAIFDKMIEQNGNKEKFYSKLKLNHCVERILICENISGTSEDECEHCLYTNDVNKVCVVVRDLKHDCLIHIVCKHVICTMSLGYLKNNYRKLIKPDRYLSVEKVNAIKRLGYGTINKIYLVYEKPFWSLDNFLGYQLVWTPDNDLTFERLLKTLKSDVTNNFKWYESIYAFECVKGHDNILCAWFYGSELEESNLSDMEVMRDCSNLLKKFIGNDELPEPKTVIRSNWYSNPYFRGSYSYVAVGSTSEDIIKLSEPISNNEVPLVLFAGEATHAAHYSTIHGAFLSGQREAQQILKFC